MTLQWSDFIGILSGGVITFLAAHLYYVRAGRQLALEAKQLRNLNILMLRALEDAGLAEYSKDSDGNIVGIKYTISGGARVAISPAGATVFKQSNTADSGS